MTVAGLDSRISGVLLSDCTDMQVYFRLAEEMARSGSAAVVVMCLPEEPYQASWVLRSGRATHAFLPRDHGRATAPHYAGEGQSHVHAPITEGLVLAGFDGSIAARMCESLGGHTHG